MFREVYYAREKKRKHLGPSEIKSLWRWLVSSLGPNEKEKKKIRSLVGL